MVKFPNSTKFLPLYTTIPFALGTGLVYLVPVAIFSFVFLDKQSSNEPRRDQINSNSKLYLTLVAIFLILYLAESRVDLLPSGFHLSKYYFIKVALVGFYFALVPIILPTLRMGFVLLGSLAVGAYFRGIITVLLSFFYLEPPFHAKIFDVATWNIGNSPSFANMLIISVSFFVSLLANKKIFKLDLNKSLLIVCLIVLGVSFGIFLQARLFSIIVFFVVPTLCFLNVLFCRASPKGLLCALSASLFIVFIGLVVNNTTFFNQEGRVVDPTIATDLRFTLYASFFNQIIAQPFSYAAVPEAIVETIGIVQFHNFFADIDRISGPWPFFLSIALAFYTLFFIYKLYKIRSPYFAFVVFNLVTCMLVLNTSVEPEGGGQTFMMVICLGSIAVRLIDQHDKECVI